METKANYVLIGLFTLGGLLGALGLLLWFAKVEVDRQYAYFDILFEDVSGLGSASDVRYNGLPVGQVVDLGLDDADSSQVRVRIEVSADTPVNTEIPRRHGRQFCRPVRRIRGINPPAQW
jgi:phospholipid/cholesterol/gamma-HCH transport system substrate-binding protein